MVVSSANVLLTKPIFSKMMDISFFYYLKIAVATRRKIDRIKKNVYKFLINYQAKFCCEWGMVQGVLPCRLRSKRNYFVNIMCSITVKTFNNENYY